MAFYGEENDDLNLDFNPEEVVKTKFEPIPAGWQRFVIKKIELVLAGKPEKDMKQAVIEFVCVAPEYAGRKVFGRFTVATSSKLDGKQKSLTIGREQIKELFEATGVGGTSLAPLVDREVDIKLAVRPETEQYDASNDVKGFRAAAGFVAPPKAGAASTSKAAAAPAAKAPGFMNKKKAEPTPPPAEEQADEGEGDDNSDD